MMVKGISRQVIMVQSPDPKLFDQAIFILKHDAVEQGINYFDTAYIYPGSESALGQIVEKNGIRDRIYISTKFPHYLIRSVEALEKTFVEQLKRLRTDYVDVYLIHMLTDIATWNKLVAMGVLDWLEQKKTEGKIKQIGFSYHGNSDMFCSLIDSYDWDSFVFDYDFSIDELNTFLRQYRNLYRLSGYQEGGNAKRYAGVKDYQQAYHNTYGFGLDDEGIGGLHTAF